MSELPDRLFQNREIGLGTTVHLHRNFSLYKFPAKMTTTELQGSLKKIVEVSPFIFMAAEKTSLLDKELLGDYFGCDQVLQEAHHTGQGFLVDPEGRFLIICHVHDHIEWVGSLPLTNGLQVEEVIGKIFPYAFSPQFGFLTADPRLCGTGLKVVSRLHLPALCYTEGVESLIDDEEVRWIQNGDFVSLSNRYTLGTSEEMSLSSVQTVATRLIKNEKAAQDQLKGNISPKLKDEVRRAYGLLVNAYQLSFEETASALSKLVLGADLGLVTGLSSAQLTALIFQQKRGPLTRLLHFETIDPVKIPCLRAQWLSQKLAPLQFC